MNSITSINYCHSVSDLVGYCYLADVEEMWNSSFHANQVHYSKLEVTLLVYLTATQ